MASSRLTEPQKEELVARYGQGESSLALAQAFGVSANTVSRVVRAALPPELYESLKQQRSRASGAPLSARSAEPDPSVAPDAPDASPAVVEASASVIGPRRRRSAGSSAPAPASPPTVAEVQGSTAEDPGLTREPQDPQVRPMASEDTDEAASGHGVLAIDDADDFGEDQGDEEFGDDDEESGDDEDSGDEDSRDDDALQAFVPIPVSLAPVEGKTAVTCLPLASAGFNGGVYMLVDKTVELQPRPLSEFSELGALPADEAERQAISVFINPREAKRQCGRSQRVIKMPDPRLLERTAPYLLAQGISRVVVEGSLYALPGS